MSDEEVVCECGHSRNSHHNGKLSCVHGSKEWCNCEKYIPQPPTGEGVEGEFEAWWKEYSDSPEFLRADDSKEMCIAAWAASYNAAKGIK
jgi:hypothetical protein